MIFSEKNGTASSNANDGRVVGGIAFASDGASVRHFLVDILPPQTGGGHSHLRYAIGRTFPPFYDTDAKLRLNTSFSHGLLFSCT